MKTKLRSALLAAAVGLLTVAAPVVVAPSASAHGWITSPPSRQDHCATGTTSFDCGQIKYEPHSVEAPKGSMLCSGGSRFSILDDTSKPWPRTTVGSSTTFRWELTARHATSTWEYFVDGVLHRTFDDGGAQPGSVVEHRVENLPAGNHTILARWNVADTANAFYACVDVNVDGTGEPDPDPDPTDPPGDCEAAAWDANAVYLNGAQVSHDGRTYQAKWWTRGENPANSGEWGVWKDLGAC
ncbi:lytic polysaccharide monooxygenase [Isoptericola sp. NEAU-Y5]|uniref:Lytic polysaccharide monooxygenase n=1 Tax=Isoptericola luteus TaxID=2879484 RepID=A0ABS7ZIF7_9MICO|nr:lytic polysaccharide monooxygenase [Isoptericola sp. NEAU-Y5]MCA5894811.1 lytic polysaccharide monooxygenase [Isoptericola sp. NEAU-Y5]